MSHFSGPVNSINWLACLGWPPHQPILGPQLQRQVHLATGRLLTHSRTRQLPFLGLLASTLASAHCPISVRVCVLDEMDPNREAARSNDEIVQTRPSSTTSNDQDWSLSMCICVLKRMCISVGVCGPHYWGYLSFVCLSHSRLAAVASTACRSKCVPT